MSDISAVVIGVAIGISFGLLWIKHRSDRDRQIFLTHSPVERFEPGKTWQDPYTGHVYEITRRRQLGPTRLITGGSAPCWAVYGKLIMENVASGVQS
jgi:hypothetical protein